MAIMFLNHMYKYMFKYICICLSSKYYMTIGTIFLYNRLNETKGGEQRKDEENKSASNIDGKQMRQNKMKYPRTYPMSESCSGRIVLGLSTE